MKKKKIIAIVGIFFLILVGLRFFWLAYYSASDYPKADGGVLDLRDFALTDDSTFPLDGEWTFFKDQLLNPKSTEVQLSRSAKSSITVPGDWRTAFSEGGDTSFGHGTYRLRILLNDQQKQLYGLYFREIKSGATVFVNDEKVAGIGQVAETAELAIPDNRPFEVDVESVDHEIDLMIHVSNYELVGSGGIVKSIQFGAATALKKEHTISFMMQFMSVVVLLLHCVYTLVIFFVFVRRRELLYLAVAFICAAISILVDDDKVLLYLFPAIGFEAWLKLTYIAYASSVFFMLQFFKSILEDYRIQKAFIFRSFGVLFALYVLFIICTLMEYRLLMGYLFTFIMLFIPAIIPLALFKVVSAGKSDAIYLLLATTSLASSVIWGLLKNTGFIPLSLPYYPLDLMLAVILFGVFWFKRFFQATDESIELASKLQREVQRKDDFLANTSHELRNPLHGIMNISQVIYESEKNLTDENKENLQILMTVSRRMSMILNDLLDIERLKEKGITLKKEEVNLSAVVTGVFDMLHFMREGKNITFVNKISDPFFSVKADENRLFQILFNLIHNAVKYADDGDIIVSVETEKGWAMIHVEDNGVGMDEETRKSIFQPYEQADSSITAIAGGIGLGLSICEQLVKLHGGTLSVKSSVGKGSTFTFTLPIAQAIVNEPVVSEINRAHIGKAPRLNKGFPRLLVVDDDPLNLAIVERILLTERYDVVTCTSGKDALALLDKGNWDLVISDVMMPNMSGYELTRKIRERFTISELPILLLTARVQLDDVQTGFYAGANDYATKPIEKIELTMRVRSLTNLKDSINERVRMEAAWLQAQIQPHFLFNTLNTIAALSEIDPPKMMELLERFGDYLHASFATQNLNQVVLLENEVALVRSYLFIERERFGHRLNVEWEIDQVEGVQVPPLAIQTIVENAINHGVLKRPEGGVIRIHMKAQQEFVEIMIADDGVGIAEEDLAKLLTNQSTGQRGIGLLNTDKRLKQLYGRGLDITSSLDIGTTVRFVVPKEA